MGVVDDVAVLEQADIRNKENIIKRKSLYSQMESQIAQLEEQLKSLKGTNETLTRQVIQANIKSKALTGSVEVAKQVADTKSSIYKEELETIAQQKLNRELVNKDLKTRQDKIKEANRRDIND